MSQWDGWADFQPDQKQDGMDASTWISIATDWRQ